MKGILGLAVPFLLAAGPIDDSVVLPTPVPKALSAGRATLLELRYKILTDSGTKLESDRLEQVRKCGAVPDNDKELVEWCSRRKLEIALRWKAYDEQRIAYEKAVGKAVDDDLETVKTGIDGAKRELTKINERLQGYKEAMEEWVDLNKEAGVEASIQAISFLTAGLLDRLRAPQLKEAELNGDMRERARELLKRRLLDKEDLDKVKEVLRRVDLRWSTAKTFADLISSIDLYRGELTAVIGASLSKESDLLQRSALVLIEIACERLGQIVGEATAKKFIPPQVGVLISGGEFVVAAAYLFKAQKEGLARVNQLLDVSDSELRAINSVSRLYKERVLRRKELEEARKKLPK